MEIVFGGLQKILKKKSFKKEIFLNIKIKFLIAKFMIPARMFLKLASHIIKPVLNKQINQSHQILMIPNILMMYQLYQVINSFVDLFVLLGSEFC